MNGHVSPYRGAIVAAFCVGCVVGGLVGVRTQRAAFRRFWKEGPNVERMVGKFSRELELNSKQQEAVRAIIGSNHDKVMAMHRETAAKLAVLRKEMRNAIITVLTPAQQTEFQEITARWDARHHLLDVDAARNQPK